MDAGNEVQMSRGRIREESCPVRVPDGTRREILEEHEQVKKRIREETGCNAFDAHVRAWAYLFSVELEGDTAIP